MFHKSDVLSVRQNPYGEGTVEIRDCLLWAVVPERGDLYLVICDKQEKLVQLLDGGITNNSKLIRGDLWRLMCKPDGTIVALRIHEDDRWGDEWSRCRPYYS